MCGLFGFYETVNGRTRAQMQADGRLMGAALAHRGPDGEGLWQDPDVPLLLGHRRLAVIDLSAEGRQPMESHSGRYITTFNGEIYNFQDIAAALEKTGTRFRGRSDTEVMLAAFDRYGINRALQMLNGMFAFALWDRQERLLHLVRDRLGKKPLYAGWTDGGTLAFASELKALRALPGFSPRVHRGALTLFMRYGYVPAPFSIYDNIFQLLPGCRLTLDPASAERGKDVSRRMEPYWSPARAAAEARGRICDEADDRETVAEFETLLTDCVRRRMVSDVPVGAFLSGGIDSSAVTALMQTVSARPVKSFSIGFRESGYDEAGFAARVAKHIGTDHHELYIGPREALDAVPELPHIYDEPFADISQIPTLLVSRFARKSVTVALSGDGGDEMLGGYVRHTALPGLWAGVRRIPAPLRLLAARAVRTAGAERWSRLVPHKPQFGEKLHKAAALMDAASPGDAYRRAMSLWQNPATLVDGGTEPVIPLADSTQYPPGLGFAESMMFGDALSYLPGDVLVKVDRASMAASLEARAPLLDFRVFEYAWSLPLRMKIRNGEGKWLLRQVLARHVPDSLFVRPKQGFAVPAAGWLRGPLKDWAEDLLDEKRLAREGFINPAPVRAAWAAHKEGKGSETGRLWAVLMFQSWLARWGRLC